MAIHEKSPLELQAQIAAFADETVQDPNNREYVLNSVSSFARHRVADLTRTVITHEVTFDEAGNQYVREPGEDVTLARGLDYLDYMKKVGGLSHESIARRKELLEAFEPFEVAVDTLRRQLEAPGFRGEHPDFAGRGLNAAGFFLRHEGSEYVVRIPLSRDVAPAAIDYKLKASIPGKGVPHLEQLTAISYEHGVTISERMAGAEVAQLPVEAIEAVTVEQLDGFLETIRVAHQAGVHIDPKPTNIFYDKGEGFGIIDYGSDVDKDASLRQTYPEALDSILVALTNAGLYDLLPANNADYLRMGELWQAGIGVLNKYLTVVRTRTEDEVFQAIEKRVETTIAAQQAYYDKLTDPEWVAEQIRLTSEHSKRMSELTALTKKSSTPAGWGSV